MHCSVDICHPASWIDIIEAPWNISDFPLLDRFSVHFSHQKCISNLGKEPKSAEFPIRPRWRSHKFQGIDLLTSYFYKNTNRDFSRIFYLLLSFKIRLHIFLVKINNIRLTNKACKTFIRKKNRENLEFVSWINWDIWSNSQNVRSVKASHL